MRPSSGYSVTLLTSGGLSVVVWEAMAMCGRAMAGCVLDGGQAELAR